MAEITIEDVRKKYPQYNDLSDEDLAKGLHDRFYSDMPFEDFASRIGLKLEPVVKEPEIAPDKYPTLAAAADVPLSFARGATTGVKMISDFFGADNPVSQNLQSVDTYLADLMSAQSKKDAKEISRIMQEAQDKGVWEQVKAGLKAFTVAPVDVLTNAFGTAAPTIVAGLAASVLAPEAAIVGGALTAGRLASAGIGAVSGVGTIKGTIYSDVKQALLDQKVPEDAAEKAAVEAQSYNGKNLDSILAGGAIGALSSYTGFEPQVVKNIVGRIITKAAAKTGAETAETAAEQGVSKGIAKAVAAESIPEAIQGGQEQLASNIAQQREGLDVPTMRGVAGAAALEGTVGAILGGVAKAKEGRPEITSKEEEDLALKDALTVFNQNQQAKGLASIGTPDGASNNQIMALANQFREKVPVLGTILDSGVPYAQKVEQIRKRLGEIQLTENPPQTAVEGRVALPAPPAEGTVVSAPEAFSTAMKSEVPMTNLSVQQGPEGYRVITEGGQILTPQVKTEREANLVMESLRREYDARQSDVYKQDIAAYEKERMPVVTEAVARAAREVQTPVTSFPMSDIRDISPEVYNAVRESRKGRRLTADATTEELNRLGVDKDTIGELVLRQKPVTGGSGAIRPEYVQEIIGPRPSVPGQTARTAEQLKQSTEKVPGKIGRKKVMFAPSLAGAEVTQTQPLSQFKMPEMVKLYRSSGMADPSANFERWTTDRKSAERFGPIREVSVPQEMVQKYGTAYSGAPQTDLIFDRRGKTPADIAKQMPVSQQGLAEEYSLAPDEARKPAAKATGRKAKREVIPNLLGRQPGEARPAGFRLQPERDQQGNIVKPKPAVEAPSAEALADAEKVINNRIERINKQGEQGKKIAEGLRKALDSGEMTVDQMVIAFKMADISAQLLGTTSAAPHDFKFFNKLVGGRSYGTRNFVEGSVNLALLPEVMTEGRNVAAHEAFHVLQDLFNDYDKASARIIRDAFRGAVTVDNVSPELLRKLQSLIDPDTGKSYADFVRENIGKLYENATPEKRERELQAYVFAALDDARRKGVSVTQFGGAFTRFLNFFRQFKERLKNYLNGRGYQTVTDVFERISRGEAQRGLGVEGEKSGSNLPKNKEFEPEDLSQAEFVPSKNIKNEKPTQGYVYHATNLDRLYQISESGKLKTHNPNEYTDQESWPDGSLDKRSYFSEEPSTTLDFAPEEGQTVLLRAKKDSGMKKERHTGDIYTSREIPAKDLEYLHESGQFRPVVSNEEAYLLNDTELHARPADEESRATIDEVMNTGQAGAVQANVNTYNKVWDSVREFFNPFALVTNQKALFLFRNKLFGKIGKSEEEARKTSDIISKASKEDRDAVYNYLTTRGASPNTIKDEKVRKAAVSAKNRINEIGQELVKQKFLTQESYDKFYDQYLPRVYLYYELTGRGMKTPLGGQSMMEYTMKRGELSKEERDLLGEIKDPAYLTYVAMSRPVRDLAMSEYLNNLATFSEQATGDAPWILRNSLVEWNGHKMTPYALQKEAEDIRQYVLPVAENHDKKQARLMLANINKMEQIAREGFAKIARTGERLDTSKYIQMPIDKRYGPLSGAYIQKGIREDLVGTFIPMRVDDKSLAQRILGDENSAMGKAVGLWKLGKTTLNLPTQVRNFVSNAIALHIFAGVPLYRVPKLMKQALTEMYNNSGNWKDAQEYGISGGTMSSAELKAALDRLKNYELKQSKDNPLVNVFASARLLGTSVVEGAGNAYQNVESLFKFMVFLNERQNQKFVRKPEMISDAVNKANESLFDYTLVNPNIRWLRNAPLGLPFITYYYKALPKLIETAVKHPMRFAPYIALAMALPAYTMAELDLDEDELESLRKSLADNIRNNGSVFFLPYKDQDGNIAFVDIAPYLPWSAFTDPIYKMLMGDVKEGAKAALRPFIISGPAVTAVNAITTGQDAFTGKPIMDPRDTPSAQALSLVSYVWNQGMPPMLSVNLNDMDQSGGAIPRVYNSLFVDGTGTDKRGLPKPDMAMTASRLLGFNMTPLKADMQRAANMNFMLSEIRKRESYRAMIVKDQSMTLEKRRAKIAQLNEQIKEDYMKLQQYGQETALASSVAQRLRGQNEE